MKKLIVTSALATCAVLCLASSSFADIKIGASISATGPTAFLGDPEAKTLEMLVEQLNAAGGINGEKIKLVLYDDGGDPNKARTFATRLVEDDKVVAIIGGTITGTTMAIISVVEEAKVPFISLGGAIDIVQPVKKFTFKTPHTDRMACQKILEDMKKRGFTKIGMISGTDGFGVSMQAQCKSVLGDYGIKVVADETYDPKDADMTAQLAKIKSTEGIQAVLNPGFGQGSAIVARNYKQLAIALPLYQSHGVASDGFIEVAGQAAVEGVRLPGSALLIAGLLKDGDPQKPAVDAFKAAYEAKYKIPVSMFGGYANDAFLILTDSIKRAGSKKSSAIRDAIEKTKGLAGTTGVYTFSPEDHLGLDLSAFRMLEINGGKWKLVE